VTPSDPAGIEVRRATPADGDGAADVYLASIRATYDFPLAHPEEEVRAWVRDELVPNHDTWVALDGGRVVAIMSMAVGVLDQLYVAPDRLGRGIGRRLLELAKQRSPEGLALYTFQVNDRARRFYERNGFVADAFGDGSGNEERQPDVRYVWTPGE
jgi:GNAT superfamily N-acetyltransferase